MKEVGREIERAGKGRHTGQPFYIIQMRKSKPAKGRSIQIQWSPSQDRFNLQGPTSTLRLLLD